MGLFNRVIGECPQCVGELEWQSRAGPDGMNTYRLDYDRAVPVEIAKDIMGKSARCPDCGESFRIKVEMNLDTVRMVVI